MALGRNIRRKKRRAVALLTAILVCMFLFMLTGALVQTQSGVFAAAQSSDARTRSRAACQSVYDYCLYQLEHDRTWGAAGFSRNNVDPPRTDAGGTVTLDSRVEIRNAEGRKFSGYLPEHDAGFEVEVINQLTSAGTDIGGSRETPAQHVRLAITTWEGSSLDHNSRSRQHAECLLRLAPLFDASVLSRGNIEMTANQVVFASKDPFRNEIRGEGNVNMPGLLDGKTVFVKHNEDVTRDGSNVAEMSKDTTGLLWAGGNISNSGQALADDGLAQAALASGGRMVNQTTSRADIYDLRPENIPQPTFDNDIKVPPGEFRFTKATATVRYRELVPLPHGGQQWEERVKVEPIDVVEYYDPPPDPNGPPVAPLKVMQAATRPMETNQEFIGSNINYAGAVTPDVPVVTGDRFAINDDFQGTVEVRDSNGHTINVPEMGFQKIDSGGSAPVYLDLSAKTVTVQPKTKVQPTPREDSESHLPPSGFALTVIEGPGGHPGEPRFNLGNGANDVVIEADGDISIGSGVTDGLATFISKEGSVTLNPRAQDLRWVEKYFPPNPFPVWVLENEIELEANSAYSGLVVYADKDVNISNIGDADWGVRGFVYARGDFNFDVANKNATFYGSVVAGNNPTNPGEFRIRNGDRATFIYDPDYLKLLTKSLPHNWTRVEPLIWSETNG